MYQLLIEQAAELYILGLELLAQQEKVSSLYEKGYDIRSVMFTDEYTRLSDMATRYMQLEIAHKEFKKGALESRAAGHHGNRYGNRSRIAG
jgi:hypothetical protein